MKDPVEVLGDRAARQVRMGELIRKAPETAVAARLRGTAAAAFHPLASLFESCAEPLGVFKLRDEPCTTWHAVVEDDLGKRTDAVALPDRDAKCPHS